MHFEGCIGLFIFRITLPYSYYLQTCFKKINFHSVVCNTKNICLDDKCKCSSQILIRVSGREFQF